MRVVFYIFCGFAISVAIGWWVSPSTLGNFSYGLEGAIFGAFVALFCRFLKVAGKKEAWVVAISFLLFAVFYYYFQISMGV